MGLTEEVCVELSVFLVVSVGLLGVHGVLCVRLVACADIDMPGSTGTGNYWDPPSGEACCGGTY